MDSSRRTAPRSDLRSDAMSPCISICTLDERGVCRGCFRTLAEISGWLRFTVDERQVVLRNAEARRAAVPC